MSGRIVDFLTALRDTLRAAESVILDLVAAVVPWLAPLTQAFIAYANVTGELNLPDWVGLSTALTVEALGLAAIHTTFELWNYNSENQARSQRWQLAIAVLTTVFYLVAIGLNNVLLGDRTSLQRLSIALLSMLTPVGGVILALRASHARRLAEDKRQAADAAADKERKRQERKQAREARKAQASPLLASKLQASAQERALASVQLSASKQQVLEAITSNPAASDAEIGKLLGKSRQAIQQQRASLVRDGFLRRNGHSVGESVSVETEEPVDLPY